MTFALTHSAMWMPAIVLVMLCGGCVGPVPDESARLQSPPMVSTSYTEKASAPRPLPVDDTTMVEKKIERNVNGAPLVNQSERQTAVSISPIPLSVVKDLQSPEGRDRYRALDYWEAKNSKTPLDPVFEAMEDDDPAMLPKLRRSSSNTGLRSRSETSGRSTSMRSEKGETESKNDYSEVSNLGDTNRHEIDMDTGYAVVQIADF